MFEKKTNVSKNEEEKTLLEAKIQIQNVLKSRTKLHNSDTVNWLKKRFKKRANLKYLHFPEELQKELEIQTIFKKFDEDHSGKLGLVEFYHMLKEVHIEIDLEDLKYFYENVDANQDTALDFEEFKNCTLSDKANHYFSEIVKKSYEKLQQTYRNDKELNEFVWKTYEEEQQEKEKRAPYLPKTFGNVLNYITYKTKKRQLENIVSDGSVNISQKFDSFRQLYDLSMDKDIYMENFSSKLSPKTKNSSQFNQEIALKKKAKEEPQNDQNKLRRRPIRLPQVKRTSPEGQKVLEEIETLVKKSEKEAKKDFFFNGIKKPYLWQLPEKRTDEKNILIGNTIDKAKPAILSGNHYRPKKISTLSTDLSSCVDGTTITSPKQQFLTNLTNESISQIKTTDEGSSVAKTEESELTSSIKDSDIPSRKARAKRRYRPLESFSNGETILGMNPKLLLKTQETRPTDQSIEINKSYQKVGEQSSSNTIPQFESNHLPNQEMSFGKNSFQGNDEISKKEQIYLSPNIYSRLPLGYTNVSPVYRSLEKCYSHSRIKSNYHNEACLAKKSSLVSFENLKTNFKKSVEETTFI